MDIEKKFEYSILFIEDEQNIRNNYVRYLKRYFKEVYEAEDGESGYELYTQKKPHILIVDISLPSMSGLEFLRKIRQYDHTTRAIMLTAHSHKDYLLDAASLKLTKYLVKPITREELKEALYLAIEEITRFQTISNHIVVLKDGYIWNHKKSELFKDEKRVSLSAKEHQLFTLLISNINKTLKYDDIIISLWDDFETDKMNALKLILKKLRKKLPKDSISNIHGEGLKIAL